MINGLTNKDGQAMSIYDYKSMSDYGLKALIKKCKRKVSGTTPTAFMLMSPTFQKPYEEWAKIHSKCVDELERRKQNA